MACAMCPVLHAVNLRVSLKMAKLHLVPLYDQDHQTTKDMFMSRKRVLVHTCYGANYTDTCRECEAKNFKSIY